MNQVKARNILIVEIVFQNVVEFVACNIACDKAVALTAVIYARLFDLRLINVHAQKPRIGQTFQPERYIVARRTTHVENVKVGFYGLFEKFPRKVAQYLVLCAQPLFFAFARMIKTAVQRL